MRPEEQYIDQSANQTNNQTVSPMTRSPALDPLIHLVPELRNARQIVDDKVFFAVIPSLAHRPTPSINQSATQPNNYTFLCIEQTLTYSPFFQDFGPFNMSQVTRFTHLMRYYLDQSANQIVILYCLDHGRALSNAVALVGSWLVVDRDQSVKQAYNHFRRYEPLQHFLDASDNQASNRISNQTTNLQPYDIIDAVNQAIKCGFYSIDQFDCSMYEHFECVENGDLNVIVPNKFIAFAGPERAVNPTACQNAYTPERLLPILKHFNVRSIVRLNHAMYDQTIFNHSNISHHDLIFPDGSAPNESVINKFFQIIDQYHTTSCDRSLSSPTNQTNAQSTLIGIHCKAGLGRTGTLIALWLMRNHRFTVNQAISWLRLMRPGSVIGEQMICLSSQQANMHAWYDKHIAPSINQSINQTVNQKQTSEIRTTPVKQTIKQAIKQTIRQSPRRTNALAMPLSSSLPMSVQPIDLTIKQSIIETKQRTPSSRSTNNQTINQTISCDQVIDTTQPVRGIRSHSTKPSVNQSVNQSINQMTKQRHRSQT